MEGVDSEGTNDSEANEHNTRTCSDLLSAGGFVLLLNVVVIVSAALVFWYLEKEGYVEEFLVWLTELGYFAYFVVIFLFLPPSLPGIPGMGIMFLICGFLFQFTKGVIIASVGLQFGTFIVCCSTRYFCISRANELVLQRGQILIMLRDVFIEQPFQFALAMRFLPQPTGLSNVFLGAIDIPIWIIQLTTFLGCTIRLCSSVYLGASARTISDVLYGDREWNWVTILPFLFGIVGVILGAVFMVSVSRKVIKQLDDYQAALSTQECVEEIELDIIEDDSMVESPMEPEEGSTGSPSEINVKNSSDLALTKDDDVTEELNGGSCSRNIKEVV